MQNKAQASALRRMVSGANVYFMLREYREKMIAAQRKEQSKEYIYYRGAVEALERCFKKEKDAVTSRG